MSELKFRREISPLEIAEALAGKGVKPQDVTIEDDGDVVTIRIQDIILDDADKAAIAQLMRLLRRIE